MNEMVTLSPVEIYARLLQHPSMQHGPTPPSLEEFQSWKPARQEEVLSLFASFNPGIWFETRTGKQIDGVKTVSDGKDELGYPMSHQEIVWGESISFRG